MKNSLLAAALLAAALTAGTASAQDVIRIGAPLPLTGPLAPDAAKQQQGYNLWAETANKAGGINVGGKRMKVEIVYVDYQSNTPRAVQAAERLITQDKVHFLFSPFGSGATKAASSVSEKYEVPTIAATASSVQVYDQGYKYLFGTFTPNDTLTEPLSDMVKKQAGGVQRVAILARNDLFPLAIAQEMEKSARKRGMNVVYFEKYAIGTLDHSAALAQIKSQAPHWIFATGYINDLAVMKKQMADLKIEAPVVTMVTAPAFKEFIDAAGKGSENITTAAWWHPAARYKGKDIFGTTENYNKLFTARYKIDPDYSPASASAAGAILQMAIEKAGTIDRKKVREALAGLNEMTFWGPVKFGPSGQITSLEPPVIQIQDGKHVAIYPAAIKQGNLRLGVK
ncbi:MAG: amino acid ABC transporter substrate-binding protein [Betaproteobacteria bacterium]|nr:amino acid ABC transporter substrate-binding protein [Betaproteobacteria bacterium]